MAEQTQCSGSFKVGGIKRMPRTGSVWVNCLMKDH